MIQLRKQSPNSWIKQKEHIISFVKAYSNRRITLATLHCLQALPAEQLKAIGDISPAAVITASAEGKLLGVGFAVGDGKGHCLIVVHPHARRQGIGFKLMEALMQSIEHFSCCVALDNISSLTICFKHQLHAVSMYKGPTGKLTLRFERSSSDGTNSIRHHDTVSQ